ncbi:MAG: DUF1992 domain-containing protein [Chloroflexi bacterium]|nr:DUF1992 domain-containing protein [Chloroflexota bacterium]
MKGKDWAKLVEDQIRDAMQQGEFNHLRGKGKPQPVEESADEAFMANKLLKDQGFVPDWIAEDKEIGEEKAVLRRMLERHVDWHREQLAAGGNKTLALGARQHAELLSWLDTMRLRLENQYSQRAAKLNKKIDRFNLIVPLFTLTRTRVRIDKELAWFNAQLNQPATGGDVSGTV